MLIWKIKWSRTQCMCVWMVFSTRACVRLFLAMRAFVCVCELQNNGTQTHRRDVVVYCLRWYRQRHAHQYCTHNVSPRLPFPIHRFRLCAEVFCSLFFSFQFNKHFALYFIASCMYRSSGSGTNSRSILYRCTI